MTDEDLRRHFEGAVGDMRRHFDATAERLEGAVSDTRRHFDVTAEGLEKRIGLVAEGVVRLDQKLDRTGADIRNEMRRGFAEHRR